MMAGAAFESDDGEHASEPEDLPGPMERVHPNLIRGQFVYKAESED